MTHTELFIKAAADLSGRDQAQIDEREALHILQEYGREPQGDLYRELTDAAAGEYFSKPQNVEEWADIAAEWDGEFPDTVAYTVQRELSPIIRRNGRKLYDDLPQDDPRRAELENIAELPELSPHMKAVTEYLYKMGKSIEESTRPIFENIKGTQDAIAHALATTEAVAERMRAAQESVLEVMKTVNFGDLYTKYGVMLDNLAELMGSDPRFLLFDEMQGVLAPFLEDELKKPQYGGKTIVELIDEAETDENGEFLETSMLMQAVNAAREAKEQAELIAAQNAGRALRRQTRERAKSKGAIMELRGGILPVFSGDQLRDAFAPGRISQMGKLAPDVIDKKTGRIEKIDLEKGDLLPLSAGNISYKAFMLLNAILSNSVADYREFLVHGGAIRFYVKGVLDQLEVDARINDPQQIELDPEQIEISRHTANRKTAGALYLEELFKPLLPFVGTLPDGSRYSVLNYVGYDIESDTMTVRSPYLFQLWRITQTAFADRKKGKEQRIAEGKKPLKADLKPLELNTLFKRSAYREDDTILEIAVYITNVLLNAGKGAHKTKIKFGTIVNNCPRLGERLAELNALPKTEKLENGKTRNNTARYNVTLRKIARAFDLIMNTEKCDALKHFKFMQFTPTKPAKGYTLPTIETGDGKTEIDWANVNWGKMELVPPTKSTLREEIFIKWHRIDPDSGR